MSTVNPNGRAALLVIDVQNGVVGPAAHQRDAVIGRIAALVERARSADVPVVWVQHSDDEMTVGSEAWHIVSELHPADGEPKVQKRFGDSFEDTDLGEQLARLGVGHVIVTGAQTDACIRSTLHGAFVRGYDTDLVSDAHTTDDLSEYGLPPVEKVIAHTNATWRWQAGVGRTARVLTADEVDFGCR